MGFELARVRGSHHILIHSDGHRTVVPVHSGETIGRGLLAQILRDCQITREEFRMPYDRRFQIYMVFGE